MIKKLLNILVPPTPFSGDIFLLLVRIFWGWQFAQTGWGKLTNIERTAGFFKELGLPFPEWNVLLAGGTECVGGMLLLAGCASRIISIPLSFTMMMAYLTAHREELRAIVSHTDQFLGAPPFLFLLATLMILALGPGRLSADYLFKKIFSS